MLGKFQLLALIRKKLKFHLYTRTLLTLFQLKDVPS